MKKLVICFFVFLFVSFFIAADENEGTGFSVGMEAGIWNFNKAYGSSMEPYLMPVLIYDNSLLNGALDVYAELDYTFGLKRITNANDKKVFPQSLYFDFLLGYNLGFSSVSTLSIIVENEFDELILSPRDSGSNNITGIFTPAVKYNHVLDFGDIYFMLGSPITYIQEEKSAKTIVGLDFTLGWYGNFGLGAEAKALMQFLPAKKAEGAGYRGLEALVYYEFEPFYVEVLAELSSDIKKGGITITPEFEYSFNNVTLYTKCELMGIGIEGGKIVISPALGIRFSF